MIFAKSILIVLLIISTALTVGKWGESKGVYGVADLFSLLLFFVLFYYAGIFNIFNV